MLIKSETSWLPVLAQWHVRRALNWIDLIDCEGLEYIRLLDEKPGENANRDAPFIRGFTFNGSYGRRRDGTECHIKLFFDDLYLGLPLPFRFTPLATLKIAFTLAHEIAHHVLAQRGFVFSVFERHTPARQREEYDEAIADRYAFDVVQRMGSHPAYKIGNALKRALTWYLRSQGEICFEKQQYSKAASYWFQEYLLGPEILNVADRYHLARLKAGFAPVAD